MSRPGQGFSTTCVIDTTSDPRMSGTDESQWFETPDGPWILEGTMTITNEEGSWDGTFRTRHVDGPTTEEFETVAELVGRGAYEGLQYTGTSRGSGDPNGRVTPRSSRARSSR